MIAAGLYLRHVDTGRRIFVVGHSCVRGWIYLEVRGDGRWGRSRYGDLDETVWIVEGKA